MGKLDSTTCVSEVSELLDGASRYMMIHISLKINYKIQCIHTIHFYLVKQWRTKRCLTLITEWSDRTAQNIKITYNFQSQIFNATDDTVFYLQFFQSHLRNSTEQFLKVINASVWETRSSFVLHCTISNTSIRKNMLIQVISSFECRIFSNGNFVSSHNFKKFLSKLPLGLSCSVISLHNFLR